MGGRTDRTLFAIVSALGLLLSSVGGVATVTTATGAECRASEGESAASPPYEEPAVLVRFDWAPQDDVMVSYYATRSDDPIADPFVGPRWTGGCSTDAWASCPRQLPLVLTEQPMWGSNRDDRSGTYALVAEPKSACIYPTVTGQPDNDRVVEIHGRIVDFQVTATIEHYRAGETAPFKTESPYAATLTLHPDPYTPPDPLQNRRILGTFDWDPATGATNVVAAGSAQPAETDEATEKTQLPGIARWLGLTRLAAPPASYGESASNSRTSAPETTEARPSALFMLLVLMVGGPGPFLEAALTGDWVGVLEAYYSEEGSKVSPEAVSPPLKSPPQMSQKASGQERRWVWLPAEAAVRSRGATHYLKPGVWYQTKVAKDGDRAFYDKKGKLIGRTEDEVPVEVWGTEAEGFDQDTVPDLQTLLTGATTGSWLRPPPAPPPASSPERAMHWVYVTVPTQTYHDEGSAWEQESHVLMPGRWYQGNYRASKGRWTIWTTDGRYLGEEPNEDLVRVSPTTPLPVEKTAD